MQNFWQIPRLASITIGAVLCLGLLAACEPKVAERGRQDILIKAGNIIEGQMNKIDVQQRLGTPSLKSQFGQESWYYLSARKETVAFFEPELVDQQVLRIAFNEDGIVEKVEFYDKSQARNIAFSDRITPTSGQEYGLMEQLLGNIGRFNQQRDPLAAGGRAPR
jgi:outer membrane protein assembly factor BamE (lipoprotein component of BamABCDE complex)